MKKWRPGTLGTEREFRDQSWGDVARCEPMPFPSAPTCQWSEPLAPLAGRWLWPEWERGGVLSF